MAHWNVFSNHGHVLLFVARNPDARLRDVAAEVGITERAVQKIVRDMQDSGVIQVRKQGRRNQYSVDEAAPLRHSLEAHCTVGQLISLIVSEDPSARATPAPKAAPKAVPRAVAPVRAESAAESAESAGSETTTVSPPPQTEPAAAEASVEAVPQDEAGKPAPRAKRRQGQSSEDDGGEQGSLF